MRKFFPVLLFVVSLAYGCGKGSVDPTPVTPTAPTSITLSPTSILAEQGVKSYSLTITAPARPTLTFPAWITMTDGTYKDYKITVTLNVAENDSYEVRSGDVVVKSTGVADVTLKVTQAGKTVIPDPTLPDNAAVAQAMKLGLGWNMGNQLDAINNGVSGETVWGNPLCTQDTFNGVKAAGFTSVRIPVTWMGHIGEAPDYLIDEDLMERVYEVVGYAENAGLNVILNTHHDEDHGDAHWLNLAGAVNSEDTNTQIKEEIAAVWTQIANKFKDKGEFLVLESFNELIYGDEWSIGSNPEKKAGIINEWNQVFVDAVRATGGNNASRWLGVPGYAASPWYLQYFKLPNDEKKKVMVSFHCYDPYDFTTRTDKNPNDDVNDGLWVPPADWGHTGTSFPKGEEEFKELFNNLFNTYTANNTVVYMGEFGCSMRDKKDAKAWDYYLYYLEYVVKAARAFGIPAFLWDNGGTDSPGQEHHCYINHGTGQFMKTGEDPVKAIVKGWFTTDKSYTLQSVYDSAPKY